MYAGKYGSYICCMTRGQRITLFLILGVASLARLWRLDRVALLHDEYSTLFRTGYDSFFELITRGVMADVHPAGVQVFMHFYTSLFGYSTLAIKLPYAFMGIAAVYLVFLAGRNFFGISTGLLSASAMACSQYMLQYSHSIRPYISGMFVLLLMVFALSVIYKGDYRKRWWTLYALCAVAAAYNHYFSLMTAGLIALSVPLMVERKLLKQWATYSLMAVVLYLPHISIFFHHFTKGSPGDWLPAPENDYLWRFIDYATMYSFPLQLLYVVIILIGTGLVWKNTSKKWRLSLLFCAWFLLPFVIGFAYSVWRAPMLQFSVLIFGFPFLILSVFAGWENHLPRKALLVILLLLAVSVVETVYGRKYFERYYQDSLTDVLDNRTKDAPPLLMSASETHYKQAARLGYNLHNVHLAPLDFYWAESMALHWLEQQSSDTVRVLWYWQPNQNLLSKLLMRYPRIIHHKSYYLADDYTLAKGDYRDFNCASTLQNPEEWRVSKGLDTMKLYSGTDVFPIEYRSTLGEWFEGDNARVHIAVRSCRIPDSVLVVADVRSGDSVLHYQTEVLKTPVSRYPGFDAMHLQFDRKFLHRHRGANLSVYIWNRGSDTLEISDVSICRFSNKDVNSNQLHWIYESDE
jgi:uncharacterized membrane protein